MRVLVTRPAEDARETAARLEALGHEAVLAPLLGIEFLDGPEIAVDGAQAVLATSANGVRALARRSNRRDVPLFAIGRQTEHQARSEGFTQVHNADGDSRALAEAVARWAKPAAGSLLHVTSADSDGALVVDLAARGFSATRAGLYRTVLAEHMPKDVSDALRAGALDAVLHFSGRSAEAFRKAVEHEGLGPACANMVSICISAAAARALAPLRFKELRIARKPNQDALLALLGRDG
jgi:uroporphyrinogen-III synthase